VLVVTNTTISGNSDNSSAGSLLGAGVYLGLPGPGRGRIDATLKNVTISDNRGGPVLGGAGIYGLDLDPLGGLGAIDVKLYNTIVSGNEDVNGDPSNIGGQDGTKVNSASSYNLIGTGGDGELVNNTNGNIIGQNEPGLMPLADNGGPTLTHALLNDSPALDSGSDAIPGGITMYDQRGAPFARMEGTNVDIGAYELQGGAPSVSQFPRVIAVVVSGSGTSHADYSIPGGSGEQLRTVPVGAADRVTVWFDRAVSVLQSSGTLTGHSVNPATTYASTGLTTAADGRSATWTFSQFPADMMEFSLEGDLSNSVTDQATGSRLDGDWSNPSYVYDAASGAISNFPSGDGTEGWAFESPGVY